MGLINWTKNIVRGLKYETEDLFKRTANKIKEYAREDTPMEREAGFFKTPISMIRNTARGLTRATLGTLAGFGPAIKKTGQSARDTVKLPLKHPEQMAFHPLKSLGHPAGLYVAPWIAARQLEIAPIKTVNDMQETVGANVALAMHQIGRIPVIGPIAKTAVNKVGNVLGWPISKLKGLLDDGMGWVHRADDKIRNFAAPTLNPPYAKSAAELKAEKEQKKAKRAATKAAKAASKQQKPATPDNVRQLPTVKAAQPEETPEQELPRAA
jgi:hypothetical protein